MTTPPRMIPQAGPAAWTGAGLGPADWMLPVGAEAGSELEAAVVGLGGRRPARPGDAPLPHLGPLLHAVADRLEHGRGFALLRGLPLERLEASGAEAALLVLGAHLGTALPQDGGGSLVGSLAGPGAEAGAPARFHADPADAVALLCLRQPREGGSVTLVSAAGLHNALMRADRPALQALHGPYPRRAAAGGGAAPVLSTQGGAFVGRYDRAAIEEEALTEAQARALAALDAAAAAPGQALSIPLHAGDLLLYNPHLVWKRVVAGAAAAPAAAERHLLRLWLAMPGSRALPEGFRAVFGTTAAGAPRGGVPPEAGLVGG